MVGPNEPELVERVGQADLPHSDGLDVREKIRQRLVADAAVAKQLIAAIERLGLDAQTGERDVLRIGAMIVEAFINTPSTHALALGLADWIGIAMDGATTSAEDWEPLKYF